jgi:hypothetical protein
VSGADWLAVTCLAGFVIVVCVFDWLRTRRNRDWWEDPCDCWMCTQSRQHRRQALNERPEA